MKWQPIETAPKDVWILAYFKGGHMEEVMLHGSDVEFFDALNAMTPPTHWMPLPPPPKEQP